MLNTLLSVHRSLFENPMVFSSTLANLNLIEREREPGRLVSSFSFLLLQVGVLLEQVALKPYIKIGSGVNLFRAWLASARLCC